MSPSRQLTILFGSAAVLAALTGCSLSGGASSGGASGGASSGPSAAASAPAKAAAMTAIPTACPDAGEVSSDLGLSVTGGGDDASSGCVYYSAGGTPPVVSINFALTPGLTPDAAIAKLKSEEATTAGFGPVSGVGDFAVYDDPPIEGGGTSSYIVASSGPVSFHVVVTTVITKDKFATLANHIIAGK